MISVEVTGLAAMKDYFASAPERSGKAASLALNQTADRVVVPRSRDLIAEQINFPAGYVNRDRLYVAERSSPGTLVVTVKGRDRPTSLLRFATIGAKRGISTVQVKPGYVRAQRRAFAINLRSGNQGFAVRLRPGETMSRSVAAVRLGKNLYLLYGPSVNQAFLSVADKLTPVFMDSLESEFLRQFTRDNL